MKIKQTAEDILVKSLVGKKFISSGFRNSEDKVYNVDKSYGVPLKELCGKIIKSVIICSSYDGIGIGLVFDGYEGWAFFHENEDITVED